MTKSLRLKLVFIMLMLILMLMTVVCVFLISSVQTFYMKDFYRQMESAFSDKSMVSDMMGAAASSTAGNTKKLYQIVDAYSGKLGINLQSRDFFILDGKTGKYLEGTNESQGNTLELSTNILTALKDGVTGAASNPGAAYMDFAYPINSAGHSYIIYIRDNKLTVSSLDKELFTDIFWAVLIGFVISVALSFLLARTLLQPILGMTKAAEEMADGDFSRKIEVESGDEIGILADTFNNMANQLETTLEEISKSEKMRREFVANVSHELRTPITSIRSYAETLSDSSEIPREMEEDFLRVIVNESDRMTKIVSDLLELSRFDAGSTRFVNEKFSLEQSVRNVYDAMVLDAKKHAHTLNLELEWKLPEIIGDRVRIEQVLINIISNAIKYTPDGGVINLYSGSSGNQVWVKVTDNGIGIPKEDLPRVFERFYRVDKARSRESGGTGLGLSIASEIIAKHGGQIDLQSEPGQGTTVTVTLPMERDEHE